MTLTLEIPDDLARQLEAIPAEERNHFAVAALAYGVHFLSVPEGQDAEPDPEAVEDIRRAVAMGFDKSVSLEDFAKSL